MRREDKSQRTGEGVRTGEEKGLISHFKYNLIIMPTPQKMSRLLWECVISMVIMSFVAREERGRHGGTVPILTTTPLYRMGGRVCECV